MVPTWTGKPGKIRKPFPVKEKSGILNRLEKLGNFTQNTGKMREFYIKHWKNDKILASFYFYFFSDFLIEMYLLNRFLYILNSLNTKLENGKKVLEKSWKYVSPKIWEP